MKRVFSLFALLLCIATVSFAKSKVSTNYRTALVLAYSQANSVYEDENIKLAIYDEKLWAINKTAKTIFIDLSQCFVVHNGSSHPMFTKDQNEKTASRKGNTTSIDEFMTVAPATGGKQNPTWICNMVTSLFGKYTTSESPSGDFSEYDQRFLEMIGSMVEESAGNDKGKDCTGSVSRHFTEDESVNNIGASIAYSFNKRSEEWTSVAISTWVSDAIFAPCYVEMPQDLSKKDKKGFGVKETKPAVIHILADTPFEFDNEKSPLVVCDWEGNFKKGTFTLSTTFISKTKNVGAALLLAGFTGGASLALVKQDVYKRIVDFDGKDADWGKMTYVNILTATGQKQ